MPVSFSMAWKVVLTVGLLAAIAVSARARPDRRCLRGAEPRRLVFAALSLYVVGAVAWLSHHLALAVLIYSAGIATAVLAAWLSREDDGEDPPRAFEPGGTEPPPAPDGPRVDWAAFERDVRDYAERVGVAVGARD